jgi:hypothetical protein
MCAAAEASYVTAAAAASAMCGAAPTMCAATAPAMCAAAETSDARRNRYVLADEANIGFKVHPHILRHACGYELANKVARSRIQSKSQSYWRGSSLA